MGEMFVDEFLPVYDVSDTIATIVDADAATTWEALRPTSMRSSPSAGRCVGARRKFWLSVIAYAKVSPASFDTFNEPGYAKTIYSLSVQPLGQRRTLLSGVMRTATTDEHARRWFRRYWTFGVGSGAHVLVNGLLDVTRELAESRERPAPGEELCQ